MRNLVRIGLFSAALALLPALPMAAAPAQDYTPPTQVTVSMYELNPNTGAIQQPPTLCDSGNVNWGCTAFHRGLPPADQRPYPYGSTNPVTVPIETDYLLDVLPRELGPYYHPTALQAQAIAARTFAYFHIDCNHPFDNSTNKQVFIPYKFESLPPATFPNNTGNPCISSNLNADQSIICDALAHRYYVSYSGDSPAHTMFFADALNHTVAYPGSSYLIRVEDPISGACDADDDGVNRHGLSGEGASRWARGHQCSYDGAPVIGGNAPGGPWSVHWNHPEQILVHYYTGVRVRDANGNALTPYRRWNPLSLSNLRPAMYQGESYQVTAVVQNTGVSNWVRNKPYEYYALSYRWYNPGTSQTIDGNKVEIPHTVSKGTTATVTLTINDVPNWGAGTYRLKLDMIRLTRATLLQQYTEAWFGDGGWYVYDIHVCLNDDSCRAFLPVTLKNY